MTPPGDAWNTSVVCCLTCAKKEGKHGCDANGPFESSVDIGPDNVREQREQT